MSKVGRPTNKEIKRKKILKTTAYIGLFILVFGLSYALFSITLNGRRINRLSTGNFSVKITTIDGINEKDLPDGSMGIELDNAIPITDEEGKTQPSYEFNIVNDGSIDADFDLYLETIDGSTLDPSLVKYQLIKDDEELRINTLNNTKIDMGTISSGETSRYELRIWLDYDADNTAMNKLYQGRLKLDAVQSTGIKGSNYGTLIAEWSITDDLDAAYYEDPLAMNNSTKVRRLSNEDVRYEGGTLVISGEGSIPGVEEYVSELLLHLLGANHVDEVNLDDNGMPIFKYKPKKMILEEGVEEIGEYAFRMIPIETVEFPKSLRIIGNEAFSATNLKEINIPNTVEIVGDNSFSNIESLEKVIVAAKNIASFAFYNNPNLRLLYFKSGVKSIDERAVGNFGEHQLEIRISNTIESIDSRFLDYSSLSHTTIYIQSESLREKFDFSNYTNDINYVSIEVNPSKFN